VDGLVVGPVEAGVEAEGTIETPGERTKACCHFRRMVGVREYQMEKSVEGWSRYQSIVEYRRLPWMREIRSS
jgi:hypothetical protein